MSEVIRVPDIGGEGEVIELLVKPGESIEADQGLLTLESEKASMEVPAPRAGVVSKWLVKLGDRLKPGDPMLELEAADGKATEAKAAESAPAQAADSGADQAAAPKAAPEPPAAPAGEPQVVKVPDIGSSEKGKVIEVLVAVGDVLKPDQPLLTLESAKASMEIPSPVAGEVVEVLVALGAELGTGDPVLRVRVAGQAEPAAAKPSAEPQPATQAAAPKPAAAAPRATPSPQALAPAADAAKIHAGPAVRLLAREFGVDLSQVPPTGPKGRVLKEDLQGFVKARLQQPAAAAGLPPIPEVDFSQFGPVDEVPLSRLRQIAAVNLHRSWVNVPHVTQFDLADITDLEAFRHAQKAVADKAGVKLTLLPMLLKACAHLLLEMPDFNSSLAPGGRSLIHKQYVHLGFAVDTPDGLLVPVIRDVDQKGLFQLAREAAQLADLARQKKLSPAQMQGACFTISSLGHIGGTAFTPIVNAPEVAILGVSRATHQPVWDGSAFLPRLMLPLSLSYDHRVINGAAAAQFTRRLGELLADLRTLLL